MRLAALRAAQGDMKAGDDLSGLPDPVYRYVKHVLAEDQHPIRVVRMTQRTASCSGREKPEESRPVASQATSPIDSISESCVAPQS
jgi:hypothetical protein